MEQKTKNKVYGVGALFVAIIFIFSYAGFNNNGGPKASTTTALSANTVYVYGTANGIIVNYSYYAYVTAANKSQMARLNGTLGDLENNGTISNVANYNATTYEAVLSGMNAYQLYVYLSNTLNYTNVSIGGPAYVSLPGTVSMYYSASGSSIPVAFPPKNYTVYLAKMAPLNSTIPIKISALITTAGAIYNNQVRLTEG